MDLTELTQAHTVRQTAPQETGAETLMAHPRLTTTRVVTTIVETHTALLVTMTLLAANAIARERLPVAERMLVTHYPRKEGAPVVKIPTVPLSRSEHLLW